MTIYFTKISTTSDYHLMVIRLPQNAGGPVGQEVQYRVPEERHAILKKSHFTSKKIYQVPLNSSL